jgi:hypothetical protein
MATIKENEKVKAKRVALYKNEPVWVVNGRLYAQARAQEKINRIQKEMEAVLNAGYN